MRLPARLLQRSPDAHKGDFGHVFVLAGSARFSGAGVLCAEAALRSGAGLVTLGIPKSLNSAIIKIKPKEVMTLPLPETSEGTFSLSALQKIEDFSKKVDVAAIGPGLSQNSSTQALARKVVAVVNKPLVIDADGLNALVQATRHCDEREARRSNLKRDCFVPSGFAMTRLSRTLILTPHPGEMARLLGVSIAQAQADRQGTAQAFARERHCTLVLKGHQTIVADSGGKLYVNKTGNPGMASAGSGDVLTGMIAAFLGQGLDGFNAAKYAVYLHGLAGDLAAKEKTQISLIASDIIAKIPEAIKKSN